MNKMMGFAAILAVFLALSGCKSTTGAQAPVVEAETNYEALTPTETIAAQLVANGVSSDSANLGILPKFVVEASEQPDEIIPVGKNVFQLGSSLIRFGEDKASAVITPDACTELFDRVKQFCKGKGCKAAVVGFASTSGDKNYNHQLGMRRAEFFEKACPVQNFLDEYGIDYLGLDSIGEKQPLQTIGLKPLKRLNEVEVITEADEANRTVRFFVKVSNEVVAQVKEKDRVLAKLE